MTAWMLWTMIVVRGMGILVPLPGTFTTLHDCLESAVATAWRSDRIEVPKQAPFTCRETGYG